MEDIIKYQAAITGAIGALGTERKRLQELSVNKAKALSEYDKQIALAMAKLGLGETVVLEGVEITAKIASNLKEKAKGVCFEYLCSKILAEDAYKNCITNIDCLKAQLNGFQSIYRHLDEG